MCASMNDLAEPSWRRLLTEAERDALLADMGRVALAIGLPGLVPAGLPFGAACGGAGRHHGAGVLVEMVRDDLAALEIDPALPDTKFATLKNIVAGDTVEA